MAPDDIKSHGSATLSPHTFATTLAGLESMAAFRQRPTDREVQARTRGRKSLTRMHRNETDAHACAAGSENGLVHQIYRDRSMAGLTRF